jgi:acyl carrier protein
LLDLGLDSLMAVELRNWIESQMQVDLPVVQLMRRPSLARITEVLCELFADQDANQATTDPAARDELTSLEGDLDNLLANVEQLSGAEVDQLLTKLLKDQRGSPSL